MPLRALAKRAHRHGREFRVIPHEALKTWATDEGLSLRQAVAAVLQEGIFPEGWERNFPSLTPAQQLTLFESAALVAGLGGLGGLQAQLLARTGVGRLVLADGDAFAHSNLNRQLLATESTLGQSKAAVTARHLEDLSAALEVTAVPAFLDAKALSRLLPGVEVVLDALDTVAARHLLFREARAARVPLVHGAVLGKFGQVATVLPGDAAHFDKIYPAAAAGTRGREVLAPTVTLIASLQVQEAVRLLLGEPPAYHGCLAHFDGDTGRLEILPLG